MNFDTALLRAFVTVAELKSVSRAAERLHRVQPAVSQQIQRLELQSGGPLFVRGRNGFELTEKGEAPLPLAVKILALNDQAASLLRDPSPPTRLKVGTSDTYASTFLPGILGACSRRFPTFVFRCHRSSSCIRISRSRSNPTAQTLGTLLVSKGNVEWLPANKSVKKHRLSWEEFALLMKRKGKIAKSR